MTAKQAREVLKVFSDDCIQCGLCLNACDLLAELGMTAGEIAEQMCNDQVDDRLQAAIQRCSLCGRCGKDCLVNLDPGHMMKAAREVLIRGGRIAAEAYDVMLVDRDWNFFTIYRETYDIRYDDLIARSEIARSKIARSKDRGQCDPALNAAAPYPALFFPGCSLAAYSPELTRAAFTWLEGRGYRLGFSDLCCGTPLDNIGLSDEADRHLDTLRRQIASTGAKTLITACPNCEAMLKRHLPGVAILSIYALMLEAGIRVSGTETLTIHDSCPDRANHERAQAVRALLAGHPQVEMASHGENTICCGSGGIVSMIDPDLCSAHAQRRLEEFSASGADTCMTSCMSCSHRLARAAQPGQVRHCLEMVFDIQVDYAQIERNTRLMWEGIQGELNIQRLSDARVPPTERTETGIHG